MAILDLIKNISKRVPENFILETLSISDVYKSTEKFFDEHFRGAVEISADIEREGFVSASPSGIAYFFRLLLEHIFGDGVLHVKMQTNNYNFIISSEFSVERELDSKTRATLENVARVSGFELIFSKKDKVTVIEATLNMRATQAIPIYARGVRLLSLAYVDVFFY